MLGAGLAMADYFQVSVDINNINPFPPPKGNVPPGAGQPGGFGQPGGGFGQPPGAIPGKKGKGGKGFVPQPPPVLPGNIPPPPGTAPTVQLEPLWVTIYLDIRGEFKLEPGVVKLDHQFGKTAFIPTMDPAHIELKLLKKEPLANSVRKLRGTKDKKDKKNLVQAAAKAWSYGLMKEFHESIRELKDIDAKNPVVIAYQKIQSQLKAVAPQDDPALKTFIEEAKTEGFQTMVVSDKGHYGLLSNLPPLPVNDVLVKRRLARLEEEFESFYYWFALQENVPIPPLPRYRLLGIVVNDSADFYRRNKNWGSMPMLGDGFTPRRDNVMVLASKRLDESYSILASKNKEWLQTATWLQTYQIAPDDLLHGTVWNRIPGNDQSKLLSVAYLQTLEIVQRAMEEEMERTTLSHEATRQLLAASGVLPQNVVAPEWILEGLAAYFERPLGAVYGNGGLPSWSNLVSFKFHNLSPRTLGKGRDILIDTISDRYFHIAREASFDLDEPRDKFPEKVRDDWERARATSWALVYYLARDKKMDRLFRYAKEVGQMPRDLELNRQALEGSFAKAFALSDAKDALRLDADRLQLFADTWLEFMSRLNLELPDVETTSLQYRVDMATVVPPKGGPAPKGKGPPPPPPR